MFNHSGILSIRLNDRGDIAEAADWEALQNSNAEWYVLTDQETRLHPHLLGMLRHHGNVRPDVGIFYGDEVVVDAITRMDRAIRLKPSFDITQLIAQDYIGWPLFIKGRIFRQLSKPSEEVGTAASYDLLLRAYRLGVAVERIPHVLSVKCDASRRATLDDRRRVASLWLDKRSCNFSVGPGRTQDSLQLIRKFTVHPHVTIVIPTCQKGPQEGASAAPNDPYIVPMLQSLMDSTWPMDKLTVIIGDDTGNNHIYKAHDWPFELKVVATLRPKDEPFNYARKMNRLWPLSKTEHIVLMNDDLVVRNRDWLEALMTFAVESDVGGVGARLIYPDGRLQHVGMALGPYGTCTHLFTSMAGNCPTYESWAEVHREYSIVTGAVFATKRSLLDEINGFDEQFSLDWNDVDMCLRMRMLGYRIVYTPHSELTHYESASRGQGNMPGKETALFLERWSEVIENDPAYHPHLSRSSPFPEPAVAADRWWS